MTVKFSTFKATQTYILSLFIFALSYTLGLAQTVPPGQVTLSTPANNTMDQDFSVTFSWNSVNMATEYTIQLDTDADFSAPELNAEVSNTTYNYVLKYDTTYYWRVRASNSAGDGPWSETRTFQTAGNSHMGNLELTTQAQINTLDSYTKIIGTLVIREDTSQGVITDLSRLSTITSVWESITIHYNAELTSLSALSNIVSVGGNLSINNNAALTSLEGLGGITSVGGHINIRNNAELSSLDGLSDGITFLSGNLNIRNSGALTNYCAVRYLITNGLVSSSEYFVSGNGYRPSYENIQNLGSGGCIEQLEAPGKVTLSAPANNEMNQDFNVTFSWNSVNMATSYTIQVGRDTAFSEPDLNEKAFNTTYNYVLKYDTTYYWRVRASNSTGDGPWSERRTFQTAGTYHMGNLDITNQAQINTLPSYTKIIGDLSIVEDSAGAITDLSPLGTITSVWGELTVSRNTAALTSLSGLNNIASVGHNLTIQSNTALTSLSGLSGITSVGGHINISGNGALKSLDGLSDGITFLSGNLAISGNNALTNYCAVRYLIINGLVSSSNYFVSETSNGYGPSYENIQNLGSGGCTEQVEQVPGKVTLLSPNDNAMDQDTELTLSWQADSAETTRYQLQVATDTMFSSPVVNDSNLTETQYTATLQSASSYYWRVRGLSSGGSGTWSDVRSFMTEMETVPAPNQAPVVVAANALADQELTVGDNVELNLSNVFSDGDNDALTYSAMSSNTNVVTASVNGSLLTLVAVLAGDAVVTVTANDNKGGTVEDTINVVVNAAAGVNNPPVVDMALDDQTLTVGDNVELNLSGVFSDPDSSDVLTYSAMSSDTNVVTASVNDSLLTLVAVGGDSAEVTITANDNKGGTVSDMIKVVVSTVYPGDLTLTTQAQVNAFSYTEVTGNLTIDGIPNAAITNLRGLSRLESVGGYLSINANGALASLSGLESLTSVGGNLGITANVVLRSLAGLERLTSVGGNLSISNSRDLTNFCAVRHLIINEQVTSDRYVVTTGIPNTYIPTYEEIQQYGPGGCAKEVMGDVTLLSPNDGAVDQDTDVTFSWESAGEFKTYHVQVATDTLFSSPVVDDSTNSTATQYMATLQGASSYYWRVRAYDTEWSEVRSFMTQAVAVSNNAPMFDMANYNFTLAEDVARNEVVGTVMAADPDSADVLAYSLSGVTDDKFSINDSTGIISYTGEGEDFETLPNSYRFSAVVRDDNGAMDTAGVTVAITNVKESPVFDMEKYNFTLAENRRGPVDVGTVRATPGDNDTLRYSISGSSVFNINDDMSGVITYTDTAGVSSGTMFNFSVIVNDGEYSDTANVIVEVVTDSDNDGYIDITSVDHLKSIVPDRNYELLNNIRITSSVSSIGSEMPYIGDFQGNGRTIIVNGIVPTPLFHTIGALGKVQDLIIRYDNVPSSDTSAPRYGAVAVHNNGLIENVAVEGSVKADSIVGGLVAYNTGMIKNSYVLIDVKSTLSSSEGEYPYVGGLVGWNKGMIENTYAVNILPIDQKRGTIGGLVGRNAASGVIRNSYALGVVRNFVDNTSGFFIGNNEGTVENNYWDKQWDYLAVEAEEIPGFTSSPRHVGAGNVGNNIKAYTYTQMITRDGFLGDAFEYIDGDYPRVKKTGGSDSLVGVQSNSYTSSITLLENNSNKGKWNMLSFSVCRTEDSWRGFKERNILRGYDEKDPTKRENILNMYYDYDGTKWLPDSASISGSNFNLDYLDDKYKMGKGFIYASFGDITKNNMPVITYGYPNDTDVTVSLNSEADTAWVLLGNPYDKELLVSTLDIVGWSGAHNLYSYQTLYWNGEKYVTSASNDNAAIPRNGGFFVHNGIPASNTDSTITLPHPGPTRAAPKSFLNDNMNLVVSIDGYNKDRSRHALDELVLTFDESATLARDRYDLELLEPFYSYDEKGSYKIRAALRMVGNDKLYRVISLPRDLNEKVSYDLLLSSEGDIEDYELKIDGSNIPKGWVVYIEDLATGNREEMLSDVSYPYHKRSVSKGSVNPLDAYAPPKLESVRSSARRDMRLVIDPHGEEVVSPPLQLSLHQNYPNPFNPVTVIPFDIPERMEVNLRIYNILGQQVTTLLSNKVYEAGRYELSWDASRYASGLYIYVLEVGSQRLVKKLTLIK